MASRVGLVIASPESADVHPDHEIETVMSAVEAAGLDIVAVPWTTEVAWNSFSALVLKSPWDYSMRAAQFAAWLVRVESETVVLNHPKMVRWNYDKRYLQALIDAGINATPFMCSDSVAEARHRIVELDAPRVVVKPTVSAGSRNTGLFEADDPMALHLVQRILAQGKTPMILPALDAVEQDGEHGLLFFGGTYSHSGHKAPILARGGEYLHGQYTETVTAAHPAQDEIEQGELCLRVISDLMRREGVSARFATPLYARIDIARDRCGAPCILEAELFEPSYFTHLDEGAADRFAAALLAHLG